MFSKRRQNCLAFVTCLGGLARRGLRTVPKKNKSVSFFICFFYFFTFNFGKNQLDEFLSAGTGWLNETRSFDGQKLRLKRR